MRKLIVTMLIAALLLTGCQMAREEDEKKTTADPLVGVLITTLSAAEDWDGDRLDAKNGEFAFGKAVLFPTVDDTICENDSLTILAVINKLLPYVQTNISLVDLISLASIGLQMDMNAIEQFRIPADRTFEAGMFGNVWCVKPNFEKNAQLLYDFIYNDDSTIPERNRENK